MQATTWVDRITDETNPWLNAVKAEERNEFGVATILYLEDASMSLRSQKLAKAALSVSCAAGCIDAIGFHEQAKLLYAETALLYSENAKRVARSSVREWLWSLWESAQYYLACGQAEQAEAAYMEYAIVSGRIELFRGNRTTRVFDEGGARKRPIGQNQPAPGDWSVVLMCVERFINLRRSRQGVAKSAPAREAARVRTKGVPRHEASFANQLG